MGGLGLGWVWVDGKVDRGRKLVVLEKVARVLFLSFHICLYIYIYIYCMGNADVLIPVLTSYNLTVSAYGKLESMQ